MTDEQWLRLLEAQSSALDAVLGANNVQAVMLSAAANLSDQLKIEGESMAGEMDKLTEEVAQSKEVKASAATLLTNLAGRVRAAAGDRAKATALANELDESSNALAAAVAANTIAEDETSGGTGGGTTDPNAPPPLPEGGTPPLPA